MPNRDATQYRRSRYSYTSMDTASTVEAIREAQEIFVGLYSAAHSVLCDDPDCPAAQVLDDPSESTNRGSSPNEDAIILILLGIVDNIGECLDLIHTLLASRDVSGEPERSTQSTTSWDDVSSGTTSHLHRNRPNTSVHGSLREPPIPTLYHDQWTRSPAVSPPAYTSFCHRCTGTFPRAPAPSPAVRGSETTTRSDSTPILGDQQGASPSGQDEQHRAGIWAAPFISAPRTPETLVGMPCRPRSPAGSSNDDDTQPRGRFAARVDSDSEGVD